MIEKINSILPQTQCGKCGFSGCKPYATAIAGGLADINQCPPGNEEGIQKLANLLGIKPKPLNTNHGLPKPKSVAFIDEEICIGCTFCIQVCPVDAIVGASRKMHTVIGAECTGCELCLAPCPVDCITMFPCEKKLNKGNDSYMNNDKALTYEDELKKVADHSRMRYERRLKRIEHEKKEKAEKFAKQTSKIKSSYDYISAIKSIPKQRITQ